MTKSERVKIIVFCKAPVPGSCKTRLAKEYGERGAAKIGGQLLNNTVAKLLQQSDYEVELCCTPVASHPAFLSIRRQYTNSNLTFSLQRNGCLGQRMYHAARNVLNSHRHVIIIGTDCPAMTKSYIHTAIEKLQSGTKVVIGPATDGGYILLALGIAEIRLFQNIEWGSSRVLRQTLRNCQRLNIKPELLSPLSDIDYAADWRNWKRYPNPMG